MKRSEAARYARWSATVALLLAGATSVVYFERKWVAHVEKRNAPPPAPHDVERQSSGLTFSKVAGNQTIFTVQASKSIDFKGKNASLLEDVKITIFGKSGERHDVLHTQSCQYGKDTGSITCSGDVEIELQSAADADRAERSLQSTAAPAVRVETRGVTFERASGLTQTNQPVKFMFPNGSGEAVGVEYRSEEGKLRLLRDVRLVLAQTEDNNGKKKTPGVPIEEVRVTGSSLEFARATRTMTLRGPAEAQTRAQKLTAGEMSVVLDTAFRAERLVARAGATGKRPELESRGGRGPAELSADELAARFSPEGWLANVEASGTVRGSLRGNVEQEEVSADHANAEMWPRASQPKTLELNGNAQLHTQNTKTGEVRTLQTSALRVDFSGEKQGEVARPLKAETLGAGSIEWSEAGPPAGGAPTRTKLQADKLELDFAAQGKAKQLVATGNVQMERAAAGRLVQTAAAKRGIAQLAPGGGWSQMELQGAVRLKEGERSALGERAVFQRAAQTATLTGQVAVRDASTETHAARITFLQTTGDIRAEGGVRSTDLSAKGSTVQLAAAPANISSDAMQGNSKTGRVLYTGHARLWQGDAVLEAESIELLRDSRMLNAAGNVRAVFPQMVAPTPAKASGPQTPRKGPMSWHVSAGTLSYRDTENQAHLEHNVVVQSAEQRMRGAALDLYFTRAGSNAPNGGGAAQQISRAVGTGGVVVEQGARRGTADRGEYTSADEKFVLSGGNPTLYDASEGTTTGRQLTFFLADDTIIVDSENGSRTLTKHRVEK